LEQRGQKATASHRIKLLPLTPAIALRAYQWPTGSVHALTLVTSDAKLLARSDIQTLAVR
jgi:hypothetical protein